MSSTTPQTEQRRGVVHIELGGETRTLKFGMLTLLAFGQLHANQPTDFADELAVDEVESLIEMTYCGLLARKKENNLPADFSLEMCREWIDDLTLPEWRVIQDAILEAMASGNLVPAKTETKKASKK